MMRRLSPCILLVLASGLVACALPPTKAIGGVGAAFAAQGIRRQLALAGVVQAPEGWSGLLGNNGGSLVSNNGGSLAGSSGSALISDQGAAWWPGRALLADDPWKALAQAEVFVAKPDGSPDSRFPPETTDEAGRFQLKALPEFFSCQILVRVRNPKGEARFLRSLVAVTEGASGLVDPATTLVAVATVPQRLEALPSFKVPELQQALLEARAQLLSGQPPNLDFSDPEAVAQALAAGLLSAELRQSLTRLQKALALLPTADSGAALGSEAFGIPGPRPVPSASVGDPQASAPNPADTAPSPSPSATPTPPTASPLGPNGSSTPSPSNTPAPSSSPTPSQSPNPTPTPTGSNSPSPTPTPTRSSPPTPSSSPSSTASPSPSVSPSSSPSNPPA